jgi:hypothetical protein
VVEETRADDTQKVVGVETEEVHAPVAVMGHVCPEVEFREWKAQPSGDHVERTSTFVKGTTESHASPSYVSIVTVDGRCELRRSESTDQFANRTCRQHVECGYHRLTTSVRIFRSWSTVCLVTFLPGW